MSSTACGDGFRSRRNILENRGENSQWQRTPHPIMFCSQQPHVLDVLARDGQGVDTCVLSTHECVFRSPKWIHAACLFHSLVCSGLHFYVVVSVVLVFLDVALCRSCRVSNKILLYSVEYVRVEKVWSKSCASEPCVAC